MDRLYFKDKNDCSKEIALYPHTTWKGTRLYDGDSKTEYRSETAYLTPSHLYFSSNDRPAMNMVLDLKYIVLVEEEVGNILKSSKIILHLLPCVSEQHSKPYARSSASFIKLAFSDSVLSNFKTCIQKHLLERAWEKNTENSSTSHSAPMAFRSGIVGIERRLQEKVESNSSSIQVAFQDMKNLIDMAKDMVHLANVMSNKIKDRHGDISDDETVKFKSYLLSLGIEDPVTRNACSSSDMFCQHLAKEIATFLLRPISDSGGFMSLSDAYCRVNRARGFELLSPEDFFQACNYMEQLNLPLTFRKFESGVLVLQLQSEANSQLEKDTETLLQARQKLTAFDVSQEFGISIVLAAECLYTMERKGVVCRDDTVRGLLFYHNEFSSRTQIIC
ncbi:vacuolar protein-sorting-associated protein 36-like [Daphnia carinata]|uniref:vacuolar protein-sorting-associated protein 36-like n=1 Tax=Daphnia carinata TaxID=120202 RepID=UPI00257D18A3|nr:vacuolar protein-sorting-associated protein 36-like [Daphnia carinata]